MWRRAFVILIVVVSCLAEEETSLARRRPGHGYKHKHHLYHHLYYLTFLAIKVKIIFIIGVSVAFALFSGKLFALLKYNQYNGHHEPEKVYIQSQPPPSYFSGHDVVYDPHDRHRVSKYSRGFDETMLNYIENLDFTELTLKSMNLNDDGCRRKLFCEIDFKSRHNWMLAVATKILRDETTKRYETTKSVSSLDECTTLYPGCKMKF